MGFYLQLQQERICLFSEGVNRAPEKEVTEKRVQISGYRFYSPGLGRWINRDPIGEEGGLLLYNGMANDPVNRVDYHGLISWWECSGYCASFHLKQMLNAIAAIEALVVTAEGMMELPISEKVINSGTERLTSLGNKIFQRLNSAAGSYRTPSTVRTALRQLAQWAKTSGTMTNLPGLRSKVDAVRRFAKTGRTVLRMARGGVVAGAAIALGIECYCMTACCRQDVREDYENRMNTSPEDFLAGGNSYEDQ
jgi:RHS repeat-associated protein